MKRVIFLLVPLFVILFSIYSISQTQNGDAFIIACDSDVYYCLRDCEAICNVTNNLDRAVKINVSAVFPNYFGLELDKIYIKENVTYTVNVPDFVPANETCYNGTDYGSWIYDGIEYFCNVTGVMRSCRNVYTVNFEDDTCEFMNYTGYHIEERWRYEWQPFDQTWIIMLPNNKKAIKGHYSNGGNGIVVGSTVMVKIKFKVFPVFF